jgi:hypothetical protein
MWAAFRKGSGSAGFRAGQEFPLAPEGGHSAGTSLSLRDQLSVTAYVSPPRNFGGRRSKADGCMSANAGYHPVHAARDDKGTDGLS